MASCSHDFDTGLMGCDLCEESGYVIYGGHKVTVYRDSRSQWNSDDTFTCGTCKHGDAPPKPMSLQQQFPFDIKEWLHE